MHANNGDGSFPNRDSFNRGKANKDRISSTFPRFSYYQGRHDDILNAIKADANQVFTSSGWTAFGTTGMSFYKCPASKPSCTKNYRIVHVVDRPGTFSTNYKQVLRDSGCGYQADVYSNTYRWCETVGSGSNKRCKQNGKSEVYSDDSEGVRTLVVFTNAQEVSLQSTAVDKLKWGPSVFAPSTDVKLQSDFADGQLIVKSLLADDGRTGDQLHGECFSEPICIVED